jgi:glycosyltransferase involved in cell wall biosynthesis
LVVPLRFFSKFEILHLYRTSSYGDLGPGDWDASLRQFRSPLDLYRALVAAKPRVIQGVEPFSYYTQPFLWAAFRAAQRTNAALLVNTFENRPLAVKFGHVRAAFLKQLLNPYLRRAFLIIAQNQGARANLLDSGAIAGKIVTPYWGVWGIDTNEFVPPPAHPANATWTILFAGRLDPEKGVFVLLDAFTRVRSQLPAASLVLAGDGPARMRLEAEIQALGLADHVTCQGMLKQHALPALLQSAAIVCVPSLTTRKWAEQVGSSLLQAMACGVPVVSTRSGAIPEYVPDGVAGLLVRENDAAALAEALLALLTDPNAARDMGQRGRAYAVEHYAARTNIHRAEELILERLE